jgi:type II secretory ATPase GspE/PulE/Tfp pilus assembly ATPase PilB-like protein
MTDMTKPEPQRLPAVRPRADLTVVEALRQVQGLQISDLLTRPGGEVQISAEDRRVIAIYANGIALVSRPDRWSGRVKSILNLARNAGHPVTDLVEVETAAIIEIYTRAHQDSQDAGRALTDGVARQRELAQLLAQAASLGANDVQIRVQRLNTEIRVRVHGRMTDLDYRSPEDGVALVKAAMAVAADQGSASSDLAFQQGALTPASGLLPRGVELVRLQYSPTSENRSALVMRIKYRADPKEVEIDSLGYAEHHIRDIAVMRRRTNGLYLLAGKVSSGKSTTLQRTLNKMMIEKDREISMFIIEEPKELDIPGAIQVVAKTQPDGTDGFSAGMWAALRSDPNVIVLGEIRTERIAALAMEVIGSGHAVWSTIHAGSAFGILDRLLDLKVPREDLTRPDLKGGLIYQRLCGVMCPHCRRDLPTGLRDRTISHDLAKGALRLFDLPPERLFLRGDGCDRCRGGLTGRTVVAETVELTPELLVLLRDGKREEMRRHWVTPKESGGMGGLPVLHHALVKVGAGLCDLNEVEEEVDLLSVYERDYAELIPRLRADVAALRGAS